MAITEKRERRREEATRRYREKEFCREATYYYRLSTSRPRPLHSPVPLHLSNPLSSTSLICNKRLGAFGCDSYVCHTEIMAPALQRQLTYRGGVLMRNSGT